MSDAFLDELPDSCRRAAGRLPPDHRRALCRLLGVTQGVHPGTLTRVVRDWAFQARRRRGARLPAVLFAVFGRLAALPPEDWPPAETVRYVVRSLLRFPQIEPYEAFAALVRPGSDRLLSASWAGVRRRFVRAESARHAARATFDDGRASLEVLREVFRPSPDPPPLLQAPVEEFTAWTDGRSVTLPAAVALSPYLELNRLGLRYLLAHELGHLECGTFGFSFGTPEGRALRRRLDRRAGTYDRAAAARNARSAAARLRQRGVSAVPWEPSEIPDLVALFHYFETPKAAHSLFNLVEDTRVEHYLRGRSPVLAEAGEILAGYEAALLPHPRFVTPSANFHRAMIGEALGRPVAAHVTAPYRAAWNAMRPLLAELRRNPPATVEASAESVLNLVEILEATLPRGEASRLDAELARGVRVPAEEVLLGFKAGPSASVGSPAGDSGKPDGYPARPELLPAEAGTYERLPEFDVGRGESVPDAVWLRVRPWQSWRGPVPNGGPAGPAVTVRPRRTRRWSADGIDVDPARASEFLSAVRSGGPADDRVFRCRRRGGGPRTVTIVIDLSVSMEAPRRAGEAPPIARAAGLAERLADGLHRAGVPTAVLGLHDNGRRPVDVYVVKDYRQGSVPARVASLHAIGVGGFRHAAAVRHLSRRLPRKFPAGWHLVVLATDAASHYAAPGVLDRVGAKLTKERCRNCTARARCPVEPIDARLAMRNYAAPNIFLPTAYEMADLRHALAAAPFIEPHLLLFDVGYPPRLLDRTVGRGRWGVVLTAADETRAADQIARFAAGRRAGRSW